MISQQSICLPWAWALLSLEEGVSYSESPLHHHCSQCSTTRRKHSRAARVGSAVSNRAGFQGVHVGPPAINCAVLSPGLCLFGGVSWSYDILLGESACPRTSVCLAGPVLVTSPSTSMSTEVSAPDLIGMGQPLGPECPYTVLSRGSCLCRMMRHVPEP